MRNIWCISSQKYHIFVCHQTPPYLNFACPQANAKYDVFLNMVMTRID